ncbi:TonB-dependent hemoglobin/transferrin/lactoferrin family receptor [Mesorhizobium sp. L-8-3]|uniref:TonB-dependent hemoglobin/transferrin/lactoferrin family receptor n=1 Tax=Mesorhizobium sp. L-8-3 TaxID=2744522 RepID=UPI0019256B01|nr:TonB-dependent hemoglobin/transferrin/lactoferrin family receptor [Mesorhizobium sp. L-8-3]
MRVMDKGRGSRRPILFGWLAPGLDEAEGSLARRRASASVLALAAAIVGAGPARAQQAEDQPTQAATAGTEAQQGEDAAVTMLGPLVVTATRTARDVYESLSASSGLSRERLELEVQGGSVSDIMRLIPGVTTQTEADDPGTAINIRGMQDFGRVNVLIDGARQNFQKNGHGANGTFYLDTEMLKAVDVTRGPVSSVYGSGAIGGVVSFTTIDADDVLDEGETIGARLKTGAQYNGLGGLLHGEAAARFTDAFDLAGAATWQKFDDYSSGDGTKVQSGQDLLSGLLKARIRPDEAQEITLSGMRYHNDFDNVSGLTRSTTAIADTFTAGYRYTPDNPWWDFSAKVYYTGTTFDQVNATGTDIGAEKSYAVVTPGFDVFNTSRLDTGPVSHGLTYGGDLFRDKVNTEDLLSTSDDLTPSGRRLAYGAFVQDRVTYDGWLEVIGAVRYDAYSLLNDTISNGGNRISPKLTVGLTPWNPVTFYATYAEGYRAPAITETLIEGFHPAPVNGRFFPNPNLRPEISRSIEAGVNLRLDDVFMGGDRLRMKAGVFRNNVEDYIDQVFIMFPIPGGYQYQNVAEARIEGFEIEGSYDTGDYFAELSGQVMNGVNLATGGQLQKVPPNRVVTTLGFRAFEQALTAGARLTVVGDKSDAGSTGFVGEAYQLVDLFARWKINGQASADLALNNIFNRQYTQYLDADPSPGFNAKLSLTVKFGSDQL